jgi:elongator complex protein 4
MAQGVVHKQPLLFAGPMKEPRLFLGTLPAPVSSSKEDGRHRAMGVGPSSDGRANVGLQKVILFHNWSCQGAFFFLYCSEFVIMQDEGLRIAWQYKKYFGDEKTSRAEHKGGPPFHLLISCLFCCW